MFYEILGGDPNSNEINFKAMELINKVKADGEKYFNAQSDKDATFIPQAEKVLKYYNQTLQEEQRQLSQQNHAPADERPAGDLDNDNTMSM